MLFCDLLASKWTADHDVFLSIAFRFVSVSALSRLLGRAQATRLDDQRGTLPPGCCDLPEFLKTRQPPEKPRRCLLSIAHDQPDELGLGQELDADLEWSGLIPSADEADALFGSGAPTDLGAAEGHDLGDFGASSPSDIEPNVSVVAVGGESETGIGPMLPPYRGTLCATSVESRTRKPLIYFSPSASGQQPRPRAQEGQFWKVDYV